MPSSGMLKILADENMSGVIPLFSGFGQIRTMPGREMTSADLKDVDILLVRSVTQVDRALLEGTPVKFVGTATIGTDHIDLDYLREQNITFASAPGCNAQAVAEYVVEAILTLDDDVLFHELDFTLGIVGLGNIGRRLAGLAKKIGWNVLGHDPLVQLPGVRATSLQEVLHNADVTSLHVPFTTAGLYPTYHMIGAEQLMDMPSHNSIINTSRGGVVDEKALLEDIRATGRYYVADVFEEEPAMQEQTLNHFTLVTPHVAGYSQEGKLRGTYQLYQALASFLGQPASRNWRELLPPVAPVFNDQKSFRKNLQLYLSNAHDIRQDDHQLRSIAMGGQVKPKEFDQMRKHYPLRYEWQTLGLAGAEQ